MLMKPVKSKVQGEGDYEAARRYRSRTAAYIKTHDVTAAARRAAPASKREADEQGKAESTGRSRARQ